MLNRASGLLANMRTAKKLFQAKRFAVEEVEEVLSDGSRLIRNIVRHPGAVVILPLVDANHVCLIQTYRVAIDRWHASLSLSRAGHPQPRGPVSSCGPGLAGHRGPRRAP